MARPRVKIDKDYILDRVEMIPERGCWVWMKAVRDEKKPYGVLAIDGKNACAHRVAFELFTGRKLEPHETLLHKCDIMECVNPDHQRIGTQKQNMADMVLKGRSYKKEELEAP